MSIHPIVSTSSTSFCPLVGGVECQDVNLAVLKTNLLCVMSLCDNMLCVIGLQHLSQIQMFPRGHRSVVRSSRGSFLFAPAVPVTDLNIFLFCCFNHCLTWKQIWGGMFHIVNKFLGQHVPGLCLVIVCGYSLQPQFASKKMNPSPTFSCSWPQNERSFTEILHDSPPQALLCSGHN